ncbi:response regulator transcription factor [uncultured Robinsoniella sp.]|uniref:response regulator transcription factor n=1 Tax=uncultured Robinsoniella sp. TaxID=904190 RepID=UPI00374FA3C0
MYSILIVEDDKSLSNGIALALRDPELTFIQAFDIQNAAELYKTNNIALVILDLNLPDGSGLDFLRSIRKSSDIPVLILTANDLELDIVTGLETGADDYITKPFSLMVLRARVNTQIRRLSAKESTDTIKRSACFSSGSFFFDFENMVFRKNQDRIDLSKTEQRLLRILTENKGITLSRAQLVDKVWTDGAQYVDENALSVTIKRLRDKLEDNPAAPRHIKTVYGIGYTWQEESNE